MELGLQDLAEKILKQVTKQNVEYVDVRAEIYKKNSIQIENGEIEHIKINTDKGIGIKLLKNGIWNFCSITNPKSFEKIKEKIEQTINNSRHYEKNKIKLSKNVGKKFKKDFPISKKPNIEDITKIGIECDKIISNTPKIKKSVINPIFSTNSKYFINSEGTEILQNFTDVIIDMAAIAHDNGITQSVNITEGGRGGLEQITRKDKIYKSAEEIATKASQLIYAKPVKEKKAVVVMNPDFVSLLTHEILGHPSEADRVLGKEMAWAGGAWWRGKIDEKIGSENLTVFDDPTIKETLGWYYFDDEGVPAQRTNLIEKGVLKNHLQNRETANIFDSTPTGNMRATSYKFLPLIRMACTCIEQGDWDVNEMIREVKEGFLISNMKIPSIDMNRYNWSISCQYAQKIENGEITELLRDVIVTDTAPKFFQSIDACGNDFTVRPITNCGKGDPMQSMIMGNGGPTIRGKATVRSVN